VPGVWTIVVAAGSGRRFGGPKQDEPLGDRTVLEWAVAAARAASDGVVVVVAADRVGGPDHVVGGATRAESVRCGLAAVPAAVEVIVVHDGARPFASPDLFRAVVAAVRAGADGAVPALAVTDTVKQVDPAGRVIATLDRDELVTVQTPQAFRAAALRRAHADEPDGTDDASLVERAGGRVVVVAGEPMNRKITVADDLDWARQRLGGARA
jgi:2-C-methyl-D-erythritol 4-phosphate cytidylyltransferase